MNYYFIDLKLALSQNEDGDSKTNETIVEINKNFKLMQLKMSEISKDVINNATFFNNSLKSYHNKYSKTFNEILEKIKSKIF